MTGNRRHAVGALLLAVALLAGCARPPATAPPPPVEPPAAPPPPPPARLWTAGTQEVPVIMYHDVVDRKEIFFDLETSEFERQLAALRSAGAGVRDAAWLG